MTGPTPLPRADQDPRWPAGPVGGPEDLAWRLNDLRWLVQRTKIEQAKRFLHLGRAGLESDQSRRRIEKRLDRIEGKLDELLARLDD